MKIFKSFIVMAMALTAGFFTSCSDEGCWEPYDAYSKDTYSFELKEVNYVLTPVDTVRQVALRVFRNSANGNDTIPVSVNVSDAAIMTYDTAAVIFNNGKDFAEFVINVDYDNIALGTKYTAKIDFLVDSVRYFEHNASLTGYTGTTVSVLIEYNWQSIGNALYTEGLVGTFFGVQNLTYEVAAEQAVENPNIIRLVDPYGAAYPYNAPGDYDTTKKHYMTFNCEDPEGVYMDGYHQSGMDWGYGEFTFGCLAYYYMSKGNPFEAVKAAGYCGTLDENLCITFPAKSMLISMKDYNNNGLYTSNSAGAFKVDLSTTTIAE
ncbi:MAG: hypothetical protein IKY19_09430 [Bacteroidaceae bacterium]|nr:hypothetical protein [Bacteroidaceae bacterium]